MNFSWWESLASLRAFLLVASLLLLLPLLLLDSEYIRWSIIRFTPSLSLSLSVSILSDTSDNFCLCCVAFFFFYLVAFPLSPCPSGDESGLTAQKKKNKKRDRQKRLWNNIWFICLYRYTKPISGIGIGAQKYNAEVRVSRSDVDSHLVQLSDRLRHVRQVNIIRQDGTLVVVFFFFLFFAQSLLVLFMSCVTRSVPSRVVLLRGSHHHLSRTRAHMTP